MEKYLKFWAKYGIHAFIIIAIINAATMLQRIHLGTYTMTTGILDIIIFGCMGMGIYYLGQFKASLEKINDPIFMVGIKTVCDNFRKDKGLSQNDVVNMYSNGDMQLLLQAEGETEKYLMIPDPYHNGELIFIETSDLKELNRTLEEFGKELKRQEKEEKK